MIVQSERAVLGKVLHEHGPVGARLHVGHVYSRLDFANFFIFLFEKYLILTEEQGAAAAAVALISGAAVHWTAAAWLSLALSPPEGWVAVGGDR